MVQSAVIFAQAIHRCFRKIPNPAVVQPVVSHGHHFLAVIKVSKLLEIVVTRELCKNGKERLTGCFLVVWGKDGQKVTRLQVQRRAVFSINQKVNG